MKNTSPSLKKFSLLFDDVPTIVCGDFNTNILMNTGKTSSLLKLMRYYGFKQYVNTPTHRKGAALDHIYINRHLEEYEYSCASIPLYYSDHFHVHIAVPVVKFI